MKIIGGESKSVTKEITSSWSETTLPTILSNHKLEDIFNDDGFGLFYQCLQIKHITSKEKSVPGEKKQSQAYWNGSSKCDRRKTARVCDLEI